MDDGWMDGHALIEGGGGGEAVSGAERGGVS